MLGKKNKLQLATTFALIRSRRSPAAPFRNTYEKSRKGLFQKFSMTTIVPIPCDSYKLGFIGAGKMAESIARGVVKSGLLPASQIRTAHLGNARRTAFESFGVKVLDHNSQVVEDSDVVVFSVKPQVVKGVVMELRSLLSEKQLLVSVVAGVKLKDLQEWAGHSRFIRVMPNTPAAVGNAASVISLGAAATKDDGELISKLFGAIGKVWTADEKHFDAITGLSGSGPAYIFLAIEALADGGVAAGLPRDLALGLASQTVLGAASMAVNTGKHPGQLKDDVASPGGTTIAGIHELEKAGFRGILMNAVVAASKRSRELSNN
ncbi:Pyrroline-5-carboxylate reductase [Forsythia ovata]|uniref:Pyrroline-5-carboxylate reductase n=1 Tax=Forsythia ovata TaxID=205694 RepID=A0ABD1TLZ8_9LAMI